MRAMRTFRLAIAVAALLAFVLAACSDTSELEERVATLEERLDTLEREPGPTGPAGPTGPPGATTVEQPTAVIVNMRGDIEDAYRYSDSGIMANPQCVTYRLAGAAEEVCRDLLLPPIGESLLPLLEQQTEAVFACWMAMEDRILMGARVLLRFQRLC